MDNFDLKKYLVENKLTKQSHINESSDYKKHPIFNIKGFPEYPLTYKEQKIFDEIVKKLKKAKKQEDESSIQEIYYYMTKLPKKLTKTIFRRLVDMGLAKYGG